MPEHSEPNVAEAEAQERASVARSNVKRRWYDVLAAARERGASYDDLLRVEMPHEKLHDHIADLATVEKYEGWRVSTQKAVRDVLDDELRLEVLGELHTDHIEAA